MIQSFSWFLFDRARGMNSACTFIDWRLLKDVELLSNLYALQRGVEEEFVVENERMSNKNENKKYRKTWSKNLFYTSSWTNKEKSQSEWSSLPPSLSESSPKANNSII